MPTDNWPVDFRYVSKRLVTEIVQQHEAAQSKRRFTLALTLRLFSLSFSKLDPDYNNTFDLCRRAAEAVKGNAGTLQYPGLYIRDTLELSTGYMTVLLGWKDQSHVEIAAMSTVCRIPELGSVFVALFGSASNYTGRRVKKHAAREIPSDVDGLYGLLQATREANDPVIADAYLDRDDGHSDDSRIDLAIRLMRDRFSSQSTRVVDVLIQPF